MVQVIVFRLCHTGINAASSDGKFDKGGIEKIGIGGHPGGTAAIGRVVDKNLMTEIKNLYVCDNSVMPRSGGIPPVLTLIALGKKFARSLMKNKAA